MTKQHWLYFALGITTVLSLGAVSLDDSGITFPDGSKQTTAAASEVQGYFQASVTESLESGEGAILGFSIATVPEDHRALVEYVSVDCETPNGNSVTNVGLHLVKRLSPSSQVGGYFEIPLQHQGQTSTTSTYVGGVMTRLYSDRPPFGSEFGITGFMEREEGTGTTTCLFTINGRYLPIPAGELRLAPERPTMASEVELRIPYSGGPLPKEAREALVGTVVVPADSE